MRSSRRARARTAPRGRSLADEDAPRRVLVLRFRSIGDVLLTTPMLRALGRHAPEAHVVYIVDPGLEPLVARHPVVGETWTLSPHALDRLRLARRIRRAHFDWVIDAHGGPTAAALTRASGARVRVGPGESGRRFAYTHRRPPAAGPRHSFRSHLALLETLGLPVDEAPRLDLVVSAAARRLAARRISAHPAAARSLVDRGLLAMEHWTRDAERRVLSADPEIDEGPRDALALHPFARWRFKCWRRFPDLARWWKATTGGPVWWIGAAAEREALDTLAAEADGGLVLAGLPLDQLAAVLERARAFVGNDSGPMHLAATVGTPTVGLFGPTHPEEWGPLGAHAVALRGDLPRMEVDQRAEPPEWADCMDAIALEDVVRAVEGLLARERDGAARPA